jgi:enediyne polyketide synthase
MRAAVNAMGFGGINTHIVLEGVVSERRNALSPRERSLSRSCQDAELFLLGAADRAQLAAQTAKIMAVAPQLSRAELADLAAQLERGLGARSLRAGVVAGTPDEFAARLQTLQSWLGEEPLPRLKAGEGVFLGAGDRAARVGLLFPGQGSPARLDGGAWRRRFESVRELYAQSELPPDGDTISTRVMQPAIVTASLAGLRVLRELGIEADCAIGHSLGEFTALHWAGALDEETLLRLARVRGAAMAELGSPTGAMLAVAAPSERVAEILDGEPLMIVGYNSPRQTVVAGDAEAIRNLARRAAVLGWTSAALPVSHAFHTPLVGAAAPVLADQLARENLVTPQRAVFSTVTGRLLDSDENLRELLCRQVTAPVRFLAAFKAMCAAADLFIEAGPGSVLSGLARDMSDAPVVSLDAGGSLLRGCLLAAGMAFAAGAPVRTAALFADRFTRPLALEPRPKFFANPCERAPMPEAVTENTKAGIGSELRPASHPPKPPAARPGGAGAAVLSDGATTAAEPIELIRDLVAQRAELPVSAVQDHHRMLGDLHLNSISVGQLVSEAARRLGLRRVTNLTDFANARVSEIARALADLRLTEPASRSEDTQPWPPGVDGWIRRFVREWVETKRPRERPAATEVSGSNDWRIFTHPDCGSAAALRDALRQTGLNGVVACLAGQPDARDASLLLEAGRAALAMDGRPRFVVVQHGWGGGGFARTLRLERQDAAVCVVNVPSKHPRTAEWVAAEAVAVDDFTEVEFAPDGRRFEPRLNLAEPPLAKPGADYPVGAGDVLLVTGGGKGIAAECALALARETGVKLALLGRSGPSADPELARNLARFAASGAKAHYARADVADAAGVRAAVAHLEDKLGAVTAILHGAGVNTPRLISALNATAFGRTMAPKIDGARNVLAAVDSDKLRMFAVFGSIIARTGLPGEADYATANEWLSELTRAFQASHPRCRCLALEWSVWSGTGMGERLGRTETLLQQGITPITVDEGVRTFCEALRQPLPDVQVVVTGRFGAPPTLKLLESELPLRRFLERKRVFYPGVELVVDAALSLTTDPYLEDHALQNQPLLPAVMGLEAMAQAAMAVVGRDEAPIFENVQFARPIGLSGAAPLAIRLAALQRQPGVVEVCLRSEETDFQADHFRAICRFGAHDYATGSRLALSSLDTRHLALDPQSDLYGRILFHRGRFRRLRGYHLLEARKCVAEISPDDGAAWFGPYLPAEFALGNPAERDAALHAIQACVPHQRILPAAIDRLVIRRSERGARFVRAQERWHEGQDFVYDVEIANVAGEVVERWEGLRLRAVETLPAQEPWPEVLLAPYLERRLEELVADVPAKVALERGLREDRPSDTDQVIQKALGKTARIWRRPDGKPVFAGDDGISAAHAGGFTLAVSSSGGAGCDLQEVSPRTKDAWRDLLGADRFRLAERISSERGEKLDAAATRVWAAGECLKKIGSAENAPVTQEPRTADAWILLRSGAITISTCVLAVRGRKSDLAVAIALRPPAVASVSAALAQSIA